MSTKFLVCLSAIVVVLAFAGQTTANHVAHRPVCHNITGTCLSQGFICANDDVVKFSQRCDGVEDCADGSDEFMCEHEDHRPLHERPQHERHAFEQASCVNCRCAVNTLTIVNGQAWFPFAILTPTDVEGLMTGAASQYGGMPCNSRCVSSIKIKFYKKTGVCRGWLCCARQVQCINCFNTGACTGFQPDFPRRCYKV